MLFTPLFNGCKVNFNKCVKLKDDVSFFLSHDGTCAVKFFFPFLEEKGEGFVFLKDVVP